MAFSLPTFGDVMAALGTAGLFLLPGLALVLWLRNGAAGDADAVHDWRAILLLAPGVTIALFPLAMLAARPLGLRLGAWAAWGMIGLGAAGVAAALWRRRPRLTRSTFQLVDLVLLVVVAVAVLVRFQVVRDLQIPSWGDSVHHTVIVQLLQNHGGLFDSWEPYAPFSTFTVQYGFHATTAFFDWLAGLPTPRAVVLSGQIFSVLAVLGLYPLAARVSGSRWGGTAAVLVAGLLTPIPMMYVNWGRYPQLAGQAVLPALAWLVLELLEGPKRRRDAVALAALTGLTAAGGLLCSYRMLHFYGVLAVMLFVMCAPWRGATAAAANAEPAARRSGSALRGAVGRVVLAVIVAAALLLPWQLSMRAGILDETFISTLTGTPMLQRVLDNYRLLGFMPIYNPPVLLAAAAVGFVWAILRRRREGIAIGLWALALLPIVALRLVRFPTSAFFDNFELVIAFYMPVALLAAWLAAEALRLLERRWPRAVVGAAVALALALTAWGAAERLRVLDASYFLVTAPDLDAFAWIRSNVPESAVFAVNGFTVYGRTSIVGSDAGWWIPLLAGRANLMPPQYALTSERESIPGYRQMVTDLIIALATSPPPSPPGVAALCRAGATHVYVGQTQGTTGRPAANEAAVRFDPEALSASADFTVLYHRERVWVFALTPAACPR